METFNELKTQANKLRKEGKFTEAVELYKKCTDHYKNECGSWELWGYAFSLSKLKDYPAALDICREIFKREAGFEPNKNLYAWCIYYTEIKKEKIENKFQYEKAANGILGLSKQEDKFSPYLATVFKVLTVYKEPFNADKIIEWCGKLNPETLDEETFTFENDKGKETELASKREEYYALLSQAYFEKGQYQDCIEICNRGLNQVSKLHYGNEVWFERRIALSYHRTGQNELALSILLKLLPKKREWFILKEIAQLYLEAGDTNQSLDYCIEAALLPGDADKKANLYLMLADLLIAKNETKSALEHLLLVYKIKTEEQQKIPQGLEERIKSLGGDIAAEFVSRQYLSRCRNTWNQVKFKGQETQEGTIDKMLPHGKAGFIKPISGKESHYFVVANFKGKRDLIKQGLKVKFYLEESFDKVKNKKSMEAVNIVPLR